MKFVVFIFSISIAVVGFNAYADQSGSEKAAATTDNVKREAKKAVNRTKEFVCAEGDAKCLGRKAKHRASEAADYVDDKTKEASDKLDSDGKPRK